MKIACDHCEKVADESVTFGWFKVVALECISDYGTEKPEGRFCSVACFVARYDPKAQSDASTRVMG